MCLQLSLISNLSIPTFINSLSLNLSIPCSELHLLRASQKSAEAGIPRCIKYQTSQNPLCFLLLTTNKVARPPSACTKIFLLLAAPGSQPEVNFYQKQHQEQSINRLIPEGRRRRSIQLESRSDDRQQCISRSDILHILHILHQPSAFESQLHCRRLRVDSQTAASAATLIKTSLANWQVTVGKI